MTPAVSSSALHSLSVIFSHLHCTDTVSKACSLSVTLRRLGLLNVCSGLGVLRFVEAENGVFKIGKCANEIKDVAVVMMILQHVKSSLCIQSHLIEIQYNLALLRNEPTD